MRELLLRRADRNLFASDAEIDRLVGFSGGHPRELLRLLKLCCELADDNIDERVVERSIAQLASDYRDFLKPADYASPTLSLTRHREATTSRRSSCCTGWHCCRHDGTWRCSHPVVRTLEGYRIAVVPTAPPA